MKVPVLSFAILLIAGPVVAVADDLEDAFQSLKQAESKKDAAVVKKLAVQTCALARQVSSRPIPQSGEEKEAWTARIAYARDIELYTEYALYVSAVGGPAATTVDLLSTLEQQNPKSKYLDEGYTYYFLALSKTGAASKIPAIAEKAIAHFPENEDLLLVLADRAMNRKDNEHALDYAERVLAVLSNHPKPDGMSAADWARKRNTAMGRGHWIAGLMHHAKRDLFEADKDLRAALPLLKGNDALTASTFFYLGVVNYELGSAMRNRARIMEAAGFSDQAAAIKGPLAQQAWRNAQVMRNEALKMR